MTFLRKMPVEIADRLPEVMCRIAFLRAASQALSQLNADDLDAVADACVWQGLSCWTQDLEEMLQHLNDLARTPPKALPPSLK